MKIAVLLDRKAHPSVFLFENYCWEIDEVRNNMNNSISWRESLLPLFSGMNASFF